MIGFLRTLWDALVEGYKSNYVWRTNCDHTSTTFSNIGGGWLVCHRCGTLINLKKETDDVGRTKEGK